MPLYVTEYAEIGKDTLGRLLSCAQEPALAEQKITISASSAQSAAFNANTRFVRLHTDVACSVVFGSDPTATADSKPFTVGQTGYIAVTPGQKLAVIAGAASSSPPAIASHTTALGSGTVAKPSGTAAGDLLVIQIRDYFNQTFTAPAGFTAPQAFVSNIRHMVYIKIADGSEGANFTVGGASGLTEVSCTRITGANATNPINASDRASESMTSPSVTTTVDKCLILSLNAKADSGIITKPSAMTSQYVLQYYYNDGESDYIMYQGLAYTTKDTAGATGTFAWTTSNVGGLRYSTYTLAIAPA